MSKLILFIVVLSGCFLNCSAQNLVVESFEIAPKDLTARTEGRVDGNGRKCAVVKVYVKDAITDTDGPVVGEIRDRGMEKWVYVSHDAKQIGLLFKEHMPLQIIFSDYDYPTITGQMTYVLKLQEDTASTLKSEVKSHNMIPDNVQNEMVTSGSSDKVLPYQTSEMTVKKHEWVDLGLPSKTRWATCNVGANRPEEYGDYFAWGETTVKSEYTEGNCSTYKKFIGQGRKNICGFENLPEYDAAARHWGGNWRTPKKKDFEELLDKCEWQWTQRNGVNGYNVTGPNGNSIFLPAAGSRTNSNLENGGIAGTYWFSTSPRADYTFDGEHGIWFTGNKRPSKKDIKYYYRQYGRSIRPVMK